MTKSFLDVFRWYIEYHRSTQCHFGKRKSNTIQSYVNKMALVSDFLLSKNLVKIKPSELTIPLFKDYFEALSARYSHNYSVRNIEICKSVLDFAAANGEITYNPIKPYRLKKLPPAKPVYLTPEEVNLLEHYKPTSPMKYEARDMFLFQCYTGLDYGDLTTANKSNIITYQDRKYICKERRKTGIEAYIPLLPEAEFIFRRYNYNLRLLCNVVYNRTLKEIAVDCGIRKRITTHMGRKTFAMIRLNYKKHSIEAVSKMIGHKSIRTTENYYAQVNIDLIHTELDKLGM